MIAVAAIAWWGGDAEVAQAREHLELTRTSLAATENLDVAEADEGWTRLQTEFPSDVSTTLNWALNRVLRVDALASTASDPTADAKQQSDARSQLPAAIAAAREAIDQYQRLAKASGTTLWLASRVDLREAALLPPSLARSKRAAALQRLADAIDAGQREPDLDLLGGALLAAIEPMEDPITGLPPDVLKTAATAAVTVAGVHQDNLYLTTRAATLLLQRQDPAAAALFDRSLQLTAAIAPALQRELRSIGSTPSQWVGGIVESVQTGNFDQAESQAAVWLNVIRGTEIFKTDRRRVTPHPLDRLSFESLSRLSAELTNADPIESPAGPIEFQWRTVADIDAVLVESIDHDLDLDADLISVDGDQTLRLHQNDGDQWEVVATQRLEFLPTGLLTADLYVVDSSDPGRVRQRSDPDSPSPRGRHDTVPQVVAYGPGGVQLLSLTDDGSRFTTATETGLEDVRDVTAAVAGDLEADGDLDLVFATTGGVRMFVNRGNQTFFELPKLPVGTDDQIAALAIADLDRDLDLDVVAVHPKSGRVSLIENLLHLQFRGRYLDDIPAVAGASQLAIEDVDGNVSWDIVVGGSQSTVLAFTQTAAAGRWTVERTEAIDGLVSPWVAGDFDNDSWMELVGDNQVAKLRPDGAILQPADVSGAGEQTTANLTSIVGDGGLDLAAATPTGLRIGTNATGDRGHHLSLRFKGIDDNATGRVNHYAIGSVLEVRFGPHYRSRIVTRPQTHFGIDGFDAAGSIRTIFPNGLTQTVRNPPVDTVIEEEQTLKGSCPYLYGWDGEQYAFITDCLWAAPLGLQVARNVVAPDRPWEYLKIDGTNLRPRDGFYDFRITEELWEIAYFDQVELTAVDHPADVEIWTNEKVGPPSIAEPRIFAFRDADRHPVVRAIDTAGRDVTATITTADRDFVQGFDRRLRQGLCPPHWVDLTFDPAIDFEKSYLKLTGWILPTDTSLNIQIDQNPDLPPVEHPSVWVPDAGQPGGWRKAIDVMGFPGGKTKTMIVDVTDVIDRADPRFRIRTSAQIYWDAAELVVQDAAAEHRVQATTLSDAEVAFHGFSGRVTGDSTQPETYDYQNASTAARWPPLAGGLTTPGDCRETLLETDNQMVVIGGGDEIRLRFTVPEPPPAGWVRDFVLHNVGWDKDADLNTLAGQSVGPLPNQSMKAYPPATAQRVQNEQRTAGADSLTRTQSFRSFWYRGGSPPKMRFESTSNPTR